jgi:ParB-like chromosome segregation protein Spo0J
LDPRRLKEDDTFRTLFEPLTADVYRDLLESIHKAGILMPLFVMRRNDAYVVLSGHHRRKAALELGIDKVPCTLAETYEEIENALFDNVFRRQMTEAQRTKAIGKKKRIVDLIIRESVAPEIYELFTNGKIDRELLNTLAQFPIHTQKQYLASLATEVPSEAALKEQEKKLRAEYSELLAKKEEEARTAMTKIANEKEGLAHQLAEMANDLAVKEKEVADLRKVQKEVLSLKETYTAEREELRLEIEKEMEITGKEEEEVRRRQAQAIRDKDKKIDELNAKLESITNQLNGKDSEIGLFKTGVGIVLEKYALQAKQYESPDLLLGPLTMLHDLLVRTLKVATSLRLLPSNAVKVKELIEKIKTIAEKVDTACQTNLLKLPVLDEEIKAIEDRVTTALEAGGKEAAPALTLVRE